MVTLLEVDAGTVGEPRLRARDQVAPTDLLAIVRPLVFQRIVQVKTGPLGNQIFGANFAAEPKVPIGNLRVDSVALRREIGAARADAPIVLTAAAGRDRILDEAIGTP